MFKTTLKKLRSKKGFTLMEMLIVVAIIAILIAIAIPSFSGAINKANLAADNANFHTAQAVAAVLVMEADSGGTAFSGGTFDATASDFAGVTPYKAKADGTETTHKKDATIVADSKGVVSWKLKA